jgi:peptidoglycan/xylan/chitin deacetylase (PgdA/CDA1 family)
MWGHTLPGIARQFHPRGNELVLTLDACGFDDDGFDRRIVDVLQQSCIPVAIFVSGKWIERHRHHFESLMSMKEVRIENHGTLHRPLSVCGQTAYGLAGTRSDEEVIDEIETNAQQIQRITGRRPLFFRAAGAHYDEHALMHVSKLHHRAVGFTSVVDRGTRASAQETKATLLAAASGSIVLAHVNRPEREAGAGVAAALVELVKRRICFVHLSERDLV